MENEDIIKMLDCILRNSFCEDANRSYQYCQDNNCTDCQVEFCKKQLEEGKSWCIDAFVKERKSHGKYEMYGN